MIIRLVLVVLVCQFNYCFSQNNIVAKANKKYEKFEYFEAIKAYESALKKGYDNPDIYEKLGNSYYFNARMENAARWYETLMNTTRDIAPIYYFRAAHSYKFLGKYKKAHQLLDTLAKVHETDRFVNRFLNNSEYLEEIERQENRYRIVNLASNSANSDFAPSFYKDGLVFSSSREIKGPVDQMSSWTEDPFFKIYYSEINDKGEVTSTTKFARNLDFKFHESTTAFTKYGTVVYFTATNTQNTQAKKDSTYVQGLKIFKAYLGYNNKWIDSKELPFTSDFYSTAHPALSPDDKKLYFASDMPGGYGMSDLYVVDILEDGKFGKPINLGPEINTEGRDTFPFVSKTGVLYFSSDGHLGLGGLDIFATYLFDEHKKVRNIGKPVNSSADDMTFIIDDTTKKGYFSSNRSGGKGKDDMYRVEEVIPFTLECSGAVNVEVINEITGKGIDSVSVLIKNSDHKNHTKGITDINGMYLASLDCTKREMIVVAKKRNYSSQEKIISITNTDSVISATIRLRDLNPPSTGTDIGTMLAIKSIYFETSEASITKKAANELNRIVAYLKKYPSVKIEIRSHTDSRGKDGFNLHLSNKRAKSTADYLVMNGIDVSRIKSKGFGEQRLLNECKNGVQCEEEKHLLNRRSEFVVIEN